MKVQRTSILATMQTIAIQWTKSMKKIISFTELNQLDTDHLKAMLSTTLTEENRKRIVYEIRIRNIQFPEELQLNNN